MTASKTYLYQQIAESTRREILERLLQPGDRLPSVRELAERWECTIGTAQRAYNELSKQGLVTVRPGQGTHVADTPAMQAIEPLRQAGLIHRAEAFLLEALTAGFSQVEIEQAVRMALDRWRTLANIPRNRPNQILRFAGSHDLAVALITTRFAELAPDYTLQLTFSGSLGGLIALNAGQAEIAGAHLWDADSDTYNAPFVQRLLPGSKVALLTLAHRRLGLAASPTNPLDISGLESLARSGLRFINRQPGAGTRVWLDAQLRQLDIARAQIAGYENEASTHSAVACAIAKGQADVGLAVETAVLAYKLHFIPLTTERYDLIIPAEVWEQPPVQSLANWLTTVDARQKIEALGGYDVSETGRLVWLET